MNYFGNNPFRNGNRQQLIDAALILSIIFMTFLYKLFYMPPMH